MLIIFVAYNAIKLSDVEQSQLQSSGKRIGLKNLNEEDKTSLVRLGETAYVKSNHFRYERDEVSHKLLCYSEELVCTVVWWLKLLQNLPLQNFSVKIDSPMLSMLPFCRV